MIKSFCSLIFISRALISALFIFSATAKVLYLDAFLNSLRQMLLLDLSGYELHTGVAVIVLEMLIALLINFEKFSVPVSFVVFIILNMFTVILTNEIRMGNTDYSCGCFGSIEFPFYVHVISNTLFSILALFLFIKIKDEEEKTAVKPIYIFVYASIIALYTIPVVENSSNPGEGIQNYTGFYNSIINDITDANKLNMLVFINLTSMNCLNCAMSINEFMDSLIARPSSNESTLVLVTHPDTLLGRRRCMGWAASFPVRLEIEYINYGKIEQYQLTNSFLLKYINGKIVFYDEFPLNSQNYFN